MLNSRTKYSKTFLIAICSFVYFVSYFSRKDFAAVMAEMIDIGTIGKGVGGAIGMGLFICYGAGQLVSGFLGDKIKPSYLMIFGLGTTALCNALMPVMPNGYAMIPIWALNGFAQAMLWPPIVRILADNLDHEHFVKANLIVTTSAHVSTILLYIYVPLVCLKYSDWETVFFTASILAGAALLVLIISLALVLPKDAIKTPSKQKIDTENGSEGYFKLLKRAGILPVFVCIVMMGILRDGIETWLPTLYGEAFDRDPKESILLSVALPIFSIISIVAIKALYRTRLFKNEVLGSSTLFTVSIAVTAPIVILISMTSVAPRVVCLVLACLVCSCMHGINFLFISCLPGRFAKYGRAATTSGFCNAFTYVGAAISSYGFGFISEKLGWRATTVSWIAVGAIGVLFALLSAKLYTRFIKGQK